MDATQLPETEALALLEIDGMARAVRTQDAALKQAAVRIFACTPASPGKAILLFGGPLAEVEEAYAVAEKSAGNRLIDTLLIPSVHPRLVAALTHAVGVPPERTLAILEIATVAVTLASADRALKSAAVELGRLHLATGFGGKGFFTLWGAQPDVEAAVDAAAHTAGASLLDVEVIAAPHTELFDAAFRRPWSLDPAAPLVPGDEPE